MIFDGTYRAGDARAAHLPVTCARAAPPPRRRRARPTGRARVTPVWATPRAGRLVDAPERVPLRAHVIVTGADGGLGRGHRPRPGRPGRAVEMVVRDPGAGRGAPAAVRADAPGADVDVAACDVSSPGRRPPLRGRGPRPRGRGARPGAQRRRHAPRAHRDRRGPRDCARHARARAVPAHPRAAPRAARGREPHRPVAGRLRLLGRHVHRRPAHRRPRVPRRHVLGRGGLRPHQADAGGARRAARRRPGRRRHVVHSMHPGWADTPGVASSMPGFHRVTGPLLRTRPRAPTPSCGCRRPPSPDTARACSGTTAPRARPTTCPAAGRPPGPGRALDALRRCDRASA